MYYLCIKHLRFRFYLNTRRDTGEKDKKEHDDREDKFMAFLESTFAFGTVTGAFIIIELSNLLFGTTVDSFIYAALYGCAILASFYRGGPNKV